MTGPPGPTLARAPALEMRGITKRFPGVLANDQIDLDVKPGEIHALLGENGAGKTTLMNILYGLAAPDEGQILLNGVPIRIASPAEAIAQGIGMVHQHFTLVPVLTVAENVILGAETMSGPIFVDLPLPARMRRRSLCPVFGYPKTEQRGFRASEREGSGRTQEPGSGRDYRGRRRAL